MAYDSYEMSDKQKPDYYYFAISQDHIDNCTQVAILFTNERWILIKFILEIEEIIYYIYKLIKFCECIFFRTRLNHSSPIATSCPLYQISASCCTTYTR